MGALNLMMAPPPVVVVLLYFLMLSTTTSNIIALPGCPTSCGKIDISYPFGIKPGCFRPGFDLTCTNHTLFFRKGTMDGMEILDILTTYIDIRTTYFYVEGAPIFTLPANTDNYSTHWPPPKSREPFMVSSSQNTLYVVGCGISAHLADFETGEVIGNCSSVCGSNLPAVEGGVCGGDGCCSVTLYNSMPSYEIRLGHLYGEGRARGYAFLASDQDSKQQVLDFINGSKSVVPLSLDWAIRDQSSCKEAKRNMSSYACRSNHSYCTDQERGGGYTCNCYSMEGNPYISGGCPGS